MQIVFYNWSLQKQYHTKFHTLPLVLISPSISFKSKTKPLTYFFHNTGFLNGLNEFILKCLIFGISLFS